MEQTQVQTAVNELVASDPEVKAFLASKLDARVSLARTALAALEAERASFGVAAPAATPAAPKATKKSRKAKGRKPGRPSGSSPNHVGAIMAALEGHPGGLSGNDIVAALVATVKPADQVAYTKTIRTYLSKLASSEDGRLQTSGERGSFLYRRAPEAK